MVFKEEVFSHFKGLSGAKRIELMCGLMSMCIPLEIRFFESILQEMAKKDTNALREAELKANTSTEIDTICKCDLLADIQLINESNDTNATNCDVQANSNCLNNAITQPLHPSQPSLQVMPMQDMSAVASNGTAVLAATEMSLLPSPSSPNTSCFLSQLPSRSKLIISLCLMSPKSSACSNLTYKALQQQLTAPLISAAVNRCLNYRRNIYELEDFFDGILLLLTMALHSPAFTYEQRDILTKQKEEVERAIDGIKANAYQRQQNPNYNASPHPFAPHPYGPHQSVHPGQTTNIHPHISVHPTQGLTQKPVGVGGQAAHSHTHSHSHPVVGRMSAPVPSQQYQTHPYMPTLPLSAANVNYTSPPLPNMANLIITNAAIPVSTTNSPSSSKSVVTSVATISPLPPPQEFIPHGMGVPVIDSVPNHPSYVITTDISSIPHPNLHEDLSCAKSLISCYNCGSIGHRGDECMDQIQEEANR